MPVLVWCRLHHLASGKVAYDGYEESPVHLFAEKEAAWILQFSVAVYREGHAYAENTADQKRDIRRKMRMHMRKTVLSHPLPDDDRLQKIQQPTRSLFRISLSRQ